jgi:NAD(P)-dependent dehydrogenase (short-subunit alcohol dehydrogenase family)
MPSRFVDPADLQRLKEFDFRFDTNTLREKVILVPGGTGGLGSALIALLLLEGAIPVAGFRSNVERAKSVKEKLEERYGGTVHLVQGDVRDAGNRCRYLQVAAQLTGQIFGLACFVGDPARVAFETLAGEDLLQSYETNFVGPILLAKAAAEQMKASHIGGSIVLLSSMQGVGLFESSLNYAAPKSALVHASRILAKQWGADNLRINVVAPGATVAGMAEASVSSGKYDRHIEQRAVGRFGRPEDVARAVRFLLEPDSYVTGQLIVVDGGLSLKT